MSNRSKEKNNPLCGPKRIGEYMIWVSELMEHRLHMIEGADFTETDLFFENAVSFIQMIGELLGIMGIAANCNDLSAKVLIKLQNRTGRLGVGKTVLPA